MLKKSSLAIAVFLSLFATAAVAKSVDISAATAKVNKDKNPPTILDARPGTIRW